MIFKEQFVVRKSGNFEKYYIDYLGNYEITALGKLVGLSERQLIQTYEDHSGSYNQEFNVYYFNSKEDAKQVIESLMLKLKPSQKGQAVFLTIEEIEYIRRALINEDSNIISMKKSIKDGIFNKLNQ